MAVLLVACAPSAPRELPAGPARPRRLSEAQALVAIREALVAGGALAERALPLTLDGRDFDADVGFGEPPFAIEWVSAEDRARRAALPRVGQDSPLQIVVASAGPQNVQVLVLDEAAYRYEGNSLLVQRGAPSIDEVEARLRKDVREFLDYVRDQGGRL